MLTTPNKRVMKDPGRYSFRTGDRFSDQGKTQSEVVMNAS